MSAVEHGLCQCGCGEPTTPARHTDNRRGLVKGQPQFYLPNHQARRRVAPVSGYTVNPETGCWEWQLRIGTNGYGETTNGAGRKVRAHQVFYERRFGPVPPGLSLDHLCRVRHCVNPDHLEPVTPQENNRRGSHSKLTAADVREAHRLRRDGWKLRDLAERYGVALDTVGCALRGTNWTDIKAEMEAVL